MKKMMIMVLVCASWPVVAGGALCEIRYDAKDLGAGRWQYGYEVRNLGLTAGLEAFTIRFDLGKYDNLQIDTQWNYAMTISEQVFPPDPFLGDDGAYDVLFTNGSVATGQSLKSFAVSFNWLGQSVPAEQYYEIYDSANYQSPLESGYTVPVPEPASLLLLGLGGWLGWVHKKSH